MTVKVKVESVHVERVAGVAKGSGKPYEMFKQTVWALFVDASGVAEPYPRKATVTVNTPQEAYPVGNYILSPASIGLNRFDEFEIRSPKLLPAAAVSAVKAA
jgi:hypothetical protein